MSESPSSAPEKPVIGLAGGIGAGKSLVAAEFGRLGCRVIDADAIGHELLEDPDVRQAVRQMWGPGAFDEHGDVDRPALARLVFADEAELARLNALLHPRIRAEIDRRAADALADPAAAGVVLDAAVLFEAGCEDACTHCVFVDAPAEERKRRVMAGRGWTEREWERREKAQFSLDRKRARCDYTIENGFSVPRLRQQIRQLFHRIRVDVD